MKSAKSSRPHRQPESSPEELARTAVPPIRRPWLLVLSAVLLLVWLSALLVLALRIVY